MNGILAEAQCRNVTQFILNILCLSTVPETFNARNYRRYYISKGCDTQSGCDKRRSATESACQKSYYNDWACVECCTGDSCNFHVQHVSDGHDITRRFDAEASTDPP